MPTRILVFAGSTRTGSINEKLAALVAARLRAGGAEVTHFSLKNCVLPLYNGDDEQASGVPANAIAFRKLIDQSQGVFMACPEYNSGYTPLLKNTLDWASRVKNDKGQMTPVFGGRIVALGAVSGGALGGYRGLTQMRAMIELGMGAFVIPEMVSVRNAASAFAEDGSLTDAATSGMLDAMVARLMKEAGRAG